MAFVSDGRDISNAFNLRGGQYCSYNLKSERVGQLIDKVLEFTPSEGRQVDEERKRLLDLSAAHGSLVGIFGSGATTDEIRQLLDLVAADTSIARKHLAEMPPDDPQFAHYARRIEEVNSLYLERRSLLQGSEETEKEIRRLGEAVDETNAFGPDVGEHPRPTFVLVDVGFSPARLAWSSIFCRDLDTSVIRPAIFEHDDVMRHSIQPVTRPERHRQLCKNCPTHPGQNQLRQKTRRTTWTRNVGDTKGHHPLKTSKLLRNAFMKTLRQTHFRALIIRLNLIGTVQL